MPGERTARHPVSFSEGAFLVLVAVVPIMQPWNLWFRGYPIPPADFIFLIAAPAAAWAIARRHLSIPRSPLFWALGVYGAALCVSTAASADRARSLIKLAGEFYLLGLAVLVLLHVQSIAAARRALTAWLAGTAVTVASAFAGLIGFIAGVTDPHVNWFLSIHGSLPEGAYPRVMALFRNPNMYCSYMVASLAILITSAQLGWLRRSGAGLGAAAIVAAAASLSPGLGGLLLVMAFAAWCAWRIRRPRLLTAAIAAGVAGAILLLLATIAVPVDASLSLLPLRPSSRVLTWIGAFRTFQANPWLGRGVGLEVAAIGYTNPSGVYEWLTDAHQTWLSVLAQSGVVGLAAFLSITVVLLRGARRSTAGDAQTLRTGLTVAFVAGFLYQSLTGSFENTRHVWLLIGFLAAANLLTKGEVSATATKPGLPAAT